MARRYKAISVTEINWMFALLITLISYWLVPLAVVAPRAPSLVLCSPAVPAALPAQPRRIPPLLPHLGLHRPVPGGATLQLPGSDCDLGDREDPGRGHRWEKSCGRNAPHHPGDLPVHGWVLKEQQRSRTCPEAPPPRPRASWGALLGCSRRVLWEL